MMMVITLKLVILSVSIALISANTTYHDDKGNTAKIESTTTLMPSTTTTQPAAPLPASASSPTASFLPEMKGDDSKGANATIPIVPEVSHITSCGSNSLTAFTTLFTALVVYLYGR
uniref:Secreted protein n=1 Tax=Rhabditophanes sp. KR3021 TaxID=114890 RepID=A0AC35UBF1_9BILA